MVMTTNRIAGRCLLLVGIALAASVGLQSASARADTPEGPLKIFSAKQSNFVEQTSSKGRFSVAGAMAAPGISGGVARLEKNKNQKLQKWTYWYTEIVYVVGGEGRFTANPPPFTSPQTYEVSAGDYFVIQPGTEISIDPLGDEPLEIFYAVPAP